MTNYETNPRSVDGLYADTPCLVAARTVLSQGLVAVRRSLEAVTEGAAEDRERARQLRVAIRRSSASLRLFRSLCEEDLVRRLRKRLRAVRRITGEAREADACLGRLARDLVSAPPDDEPAIRLLIATVKMDRAAAQDQIEEHVTPHLQQSVTKLIKRLLRSVRMPPIDRPGLDDHRATPSPPYTLGERCVLDLPRMIEAARSASQRPLEDLAALHRLRIANKKVRYALEILSGCFPDRLAQEVQPVVDELHDRLGAMNDLHELVQRIEALAVEDKQPRKNGAKGDDANALQLAWTRLAKRYRQERDQLHAEFIAWWNSPSRRALFDEIAEMTAALGLPRPAAWGARRWPRGHNGYGPGSTMVREVPLPGAIAPHRRVAAIDVGTNSIRLTVAETDPVSRFRVIEDLKETTRLGSGVYTKGVLGGGPVEQSLTVLERMKSVAERYHVDRIRAVGTSALREASNSKAFIEQVRRRAGMEIEVIDAGQEARLAFSSVASAFDLSDYRVAIVDLGGGSTELILGSGGVVDAVYPLPVGAVRLTETFADPDGSGSIRFDEMRRAVDRVLHDVVRRRRLHPDLMIGTGGTFTSLGRVSILRGSPADGGRFPFAVRGYEMPRSEVVKLLEWLRAMSTEERHNVAGLSSQRADIMVAGVCIIERLMAFFGIDRLTIHDGGIRDGLLAEMIDDLHLQAEPPRPASIDLVRTARAFAERCGYDKAHSEHVRTLSLRIFDQLAAQAPDASGTWARRESRELLEAAAVLHDVGMLIAHQRHQCHSYDMIVHADLPGFTRREIEIIANIARYHRRSGPQPKHFNFRKLGDDDQRLVGHLAGILRIADSLDRPRTRNVLDVRVLAEPRCVHIQAQAEHEPSVNLENAQKKADLFERAFHTRTEFSWTPVNVHATATGRGL